MGDPYPGKIKHEGGKPVTLTTVEIVASVALGGWPENLWPTAVAVASYESMGGQINVYNTYKDGHYGLFQISKSAHPDFFKSKNWVSPWDNAAEAYRIYQQAGNKFTPWEAYTNGRYIGALIQAHAAVAQVKQKRQSSKLKGADFYLSLYRKELADALVLLGAPPIGKGLADSIADAATGTAGATKDVGAAAALGAAQSQASGIFGLAQLAIGAGRTLTDPGWWVRVAQVVVGAGLLMTGVAIMAKPATGRAAEAAAKVAAPAAKAAQVAAKAMDKTKTAATSGGGAKAGAAKSAAPAKKTAAKKTAAPKGGKK